jgi:hypothetical protein
LTILIHFFYEPTQRQPCPAVDVAMDKDFSFPIDHADEHFSGMKIDSAAMFV